MDIKSLQKNWDGLAQSDPLWAILSYWDKKNNKWDIDEFFITGEREVENLMQYLQTLNLTLPPLRALDFGCGIGRITQPLSNYFEECYGVDIAPTMIDLAKQYNRHPDKCFYRLNSGDNLSLFADNFFTFIYSVITFQNMAPKYTIQYLQEFFRITQPGGIIVFQIPSHPIGLKQKIKSILPQFMLDMFYALKYRGAARMENHAVKKDKILKLLNQHQIEIIDIQEDRRAFNQWISFTYIVRKN